MVETPGARRQLEIENRLQTIWGQGAPDPSRSVGEIFGPHEDWLLSMGSHQLLLHPVMKEWYCFNRLHDSWEPTGFGMEEVAFVLEGRTLGACRLERPPGAPSALPEAGPDEPVWYYRVGPTTIGPVSGLTLLDLQEKGEVKPKTPVRRAGTLSWRTAEWVMTELAVTLPPSSTEQTYLEESPEPSADSTAGIPGIQTPVVPGETVLYDAQPFTITLRFETGPRMGEEFQIAGKATLGRMSLNDLVIEDLRISRKHALLECGDDGAWILSDLGSSNGTFVNRNKIDAPTKLLPGDKIRVGDTVLLFRPFQGNE